MMSASKVGFAPRSAAIASNNPQIAITCQPTLLDTLAPLVGLLLRDRDGRAASV